MASESLINFEPQELRFPFELNKQLICTIQLKNDTEGYVAYKLCCTKPKDYGVRPRIGILSPGSACTITVTKKATREAPQKMRCKDKFMIQSAEANPNATLDDVNKMFNKEAGHVFKECKLGVVYVSSIPEVLPQIEERPEEPSSMESAGDRADSISKIVNSGIETRDVAIELNDGKNHVWKYIIEAIVFCVVAFISWYFMRPTLSLIGSLTMIASMLPVKMIKQLVSDSVEDWVVKTLNNVLMHFLLKRNVNLSWR